MWNPTFECLKCGLGNEGSPCAPCAAVLLGAGVPEVTVSSASLVMVGSGPAQGVGSQRLGPTCMHFQNFPFSPL